MIKYDALKRYLMQCNAQEWPMTFAEIEEVLGHPLPASARRHRAWWSNNPSNNVMTRAWLEAGFRSAQVDVSAERVVFVRAQAGDVHSPSGTPARQEQANLEQTRAAPLHGFLKGVLHLPPEEELLRAAPARWHTDDNPLPERRTDAC